MAFFIDNTITNMQNNPSNTRAAADEFCFNCGASKVKKSAVVTVGYRTGGGSSFVQEGRPHCDDCAAVSDSVFYIWVIIGLAIGAVLMAGYLYDSIKYA